MSFFGYNFFLSGIGFYYDWTKRDILSKFLKIKPLFFISFEIQDAFVDYHEILHKIGIVGSIV